MAAVTRRLLPAFLLSHLVAASILLDVRPSTFFCGDAVTLTYSAASVTTPLTVYLKGRLSVYSSDFARLPSIPLTGQNYVTTWTPSNCGSAGSWFFFVQDASYYPVSSNSVYVTIAPPGTAGFLDEPAPAAFPSAVAAGQAVRVDFATFGAAAPVSAYVVSQATSYATPSAGGWNTYPLLSPSSTPGSLTGTIPAAGVSSGTYYIFLQARGGEWSKGAQISVSSTLPGCSPSTFRAYDTVTVSWPAGGVTYPVTVFIVGKQIYANTGYLLAVPLGTVQASGTSLTAQVTLEHVTVGDYYVYLRYASSTTIYSKLLPVRVEPHVANPVARFSPADAFVASRWAFLAYLSEAALASWSTPSVCLACPSCAQTSMASSMQFLTDNLRGAAYLMRTSQGIVVLSFRGTDKMNDFLDNASILRKEYLGCGEVPNNTCYLHSGFYSAYMLLLTNLMPALHQEIPAAQRATTPVVVTGHSLGGALATIAAYELSLAGYLVRGVFTFGSPRVGNLAFTVAFNMAVANANPEFYGSESLPSISSGLLRRELQGGGAQWPLRPSALFLEALEAQGLHFSPPLGADDAAFWLAWNQQLGGRRTDFGSSFKKVQWAASSLQRHLQDTTPGAGMADEAFRGAWRIAGCSDDIAFSPPESSGYSHVDMLVSLDYPSPGRVQQGTHLSPCSGSTTCLPLYCPAHSEASYATALLAAEVEMRVDHRVALKATGLAWQNPAGATSCDPAAATQSNSPSTSPSPTPSPGSASSAPSPPPSPTPSPTPSASPSALASPSATPSPSPTPASTFVPPQAPASPLPAASAAPATASPQAPGEQSSSAAGPYGAPAGAPAEGAAAPAAAIGGGVAGGALLLGALGAAVAWRRGRAGGGAPALAPSAPDQVVTTANPFRAPAHK